MGWGSLLRAVDGALIGLVVGRVLWGPLVYRAICKASEPEAAPRHLPGWPPLAVISAVAGAAANVGFGSHFAAIPAALVSALAVAAYHDLPGRFRRWRARRAELKRLRRELAKTE